MGPSPQMLEGAELPFCLQDLPEPPARLYLHGNLPDGPRVAIVGTRCPTAAAVEYARYLARWLTERGVAVISGGAKGIDAAAHQGALDVAGPTLVVAPSSFDHPFPSEHRLLFEDIVARRGGYLSRFERGVEPRRHQFLERNGLMVALSQAVVVVEAPLRSGSRNAAKWARRLGRPCLVVPSPPWNERGRGCIVELQLGAHALGGPDDVLRVVEARAALGDTPSAPGGSVARGASAGVGASAGACRARVKPPEKRRRGPRAPPPVPALEDGSVGSAILRALRDGARFADEVADVLGVSLPEVNHAVLLLTLRGEVDQGPAGEITTTRR